MRKINIDRAAVRSSLKTALNTIPRVARIMLGVAFVFAVSGANVLIVEAASLTTSSVALSDSRPSQTAVSYTYTGSTVSLSAIKCIKVVLATTATGTTVPTGLSTSGVTLGGASNYIPTPASWTADGTTTNGTVKITFATGETPASSSARTVVISGITNSSVADTGYFYQFSTYNNIDCSSSPVDNSTVTFINTNGQAVSISVDPTLIFTVAGKASGSTCNGATTNVTTTATTIPFGTGTSGANKIAAQDLTVTTNAGSGYTVYGRYTAKPTYGANTIADFTGSNTTPTAFSAAGTEAFGYTTSDATLGTGTAARFTTAGPKWAAFTTTNAEVAYSAASISSDVNCVGEQVGISGTTPAGSYTTTVIFTATPIY